MKQNSKNNSDDYMQKNDFNTGLINNIISFSITVDESNKKYNSVIELSVELLNSVYSEDFRHSYYSISTHLNTIIQDRINELQEELQNKFKNENNNSAAFNIKEEIDFEISKIIHQINAFFNDIYTNKKLTENAKKCTKKLIDHINLELFHIQRNINNLNKLRDIEKSYKSANNEISKTLKENEKITIKINNINKNVSNFNNQLVSILGIFTGIIIAFFGSSSIIGNALGNMHLVNRYKIVFVVSLVGLLTINIIATLLTTIGKILDKNLHVTMCDFEIKCEDCNRCELKKKKRIILMFIHKYPYIFFINLIILIIMFSDFILWLIYHSK